MRNMNLYSFEDIIEFSQISFYLPEKHLNCMHFNRKKYLKDRILEFYLENAFTLTNSFSGKCFAILNTFSLASQRLIPRRSKRFTSSSAMFSQGVPAIHSNLNTSTTSVPFIFKYIFFNASITTFSWPTIIPVWNGKVTFRKWSHEIVLWYRASGEKVPVIVWTLTLSRIAVVFIRCHWWRRRHCSRNIKSSVVSLWFLLPFLYFRGWCFVAVDRNGF